ncbi:cell surface protein SprA [Flavobacteriaceae bacterium F08102]|nr:cell surface protein SprA [Flavobacteriaceae bacterium F08102]
MLFFVASLSAQTPPPVSVKDSTKTTTPIVNAKTKDTTKLDSIKKLPYNFKQEDSGRLFLSHLKNSEVVFDARTNTYKFVEKVGDYYVANPMYMTKEEYEEYRLNKDILAYFREKSRAYGGRDKSADAQKDILPKYYVKSELFQNIFGGNQIEVDPRGSVLIKMGILSQKVDNPQISERNRQSTTFDFDQEISASLNAKVGERLKVAMNFDTQASFNFNNQVKLEYTPTEDDIIQKIEVGDVSMPIQNSLVTGAQNLFGLKTQLQFGRTTVTGVYAQQRSQTNSISAQGGSTITEFELSASNYDDNRHFFLSQKFRDDYNKALANLPLINSTKQITQIEVWVTNKNNTTEEVRNIVAIADLGEGDPTNIYSGLVSSTGQQDPSNEANSLNNFLTPNGGIRDISTVTSTLAGYKQGTDYSILENARRLTLGVDFTMNAQLGYISLNRKLTDSEILAVAYEYTDVTGNTVYRVGELSTDGVTAPKNLVVKLLRGEIVNTTIPVWDLMMKNIYALPQAYALNRDGFRLEVLYQDDKEGVDVNILQNAATTKAQNSTLLNLLNIDRLDQSQNLLPEGDGLFDYVEGITVNSQDGTIIFPTVQPFGKSTTSPPTNPGELGEILTDPADDIYVFSELYDRTKSQAQNDFQYKDKYILKGYFKSEAGSGGIPLNAINVQRGSVTVTSGGRELLEGSDYVVDYITGTVQIINPSLANAPINVSVENNNGFIQKQRTFMGVDVQHVFSDDFSIGGTLVNLREKPLGKTQFGGESVNNTMLGFNINYQTEVPKLTKWVNKLPNIDTDVASVFSIRAEGAYMIPGTAKNKNGGVNGEIASYIDDFEGSQIPLDISSPRQWFLASTPQHQTDPDLQFTGDPSDPDLLRFGKKRSQLSWYTIDRLFYGNSLKPQNINDDELSRAEVRAVTYRELFPELQLDITQSNIVNTLDLAYFPQERGMYNFDEENLNPDGTFSDPEKRWGGIMRALNTTDFQQANVEYIQFWLMDPYENYSIRPEEGGPTTLNPSDFTGELYFNLGNVSEDILKDDRRMFENGLPTDGKKIHKPNIGANVDSTAWSDIPVNQSLIYAFSEEDKHRPNQDLGLDGLTDEEEAARFGTQFGPDPANDNYNYFRGQDLDAQNASIITRYKNFNKTQGNSTTINNSPESYPTSATSFPDVEDINKDQTMSAVESYFQYKVSLDRADLKVGHNNIVDQKEVAVTLPNGTTQNAKWYQFRIPISSPNEVIGSISDFNSIRFMRMFLAKFKIPVVLRFGELQLVRGDWRRYTKTLKDNNDPQEDLTDEENQNFEVGVVNIQENEFKTPIPYTLPPGVERERLQGTTTLQEQNEQSLLMRVNELKPGETRAVFKNILFDLRMFNRLKMFLHAESIKGKPSVGDDDLTAIVRLGSDIDNNYYQLEIPLKITAEGASFADEIWPSENELNADLKAFGRLKLERVNSGAPLNEVYPSVASTPIADLRIKGNPNLGNIKTLMIGVKNTSNQDVNAELWFNELRATDVDNEGGWAAVVNADLNVADFANVTVSGRANSQGFGSVSQSVNERSQEDVKQYDIITTVNLGQLLPKTAGINLPFNFSFAEEFADPKWDPKYQDVLFDKDDANANSARDFTKRRSVSLVNVGKQRTNTEKKQRIYDIENVSVSYVYNDTYHRDYNVERFLDQNVRASANYNYAFKPLEFVPFKGSKFLEKNSLFRFVKEFNVNLLPSTLTLNSNIIRSYNEQLSRPLVTGLPAIPALKQRRFLFDYDYNISYDLTRSLRFSLGASNNFIYDQDVEDATLFTNFFRVGRSDHYHQTFDANYQIPINKISWFDFVNANYNYVADFDWQSAANSYKDQVGNTIQNSNQHNLGGDLDLTKLYKRTGIVNLAKKKTKKRSKNSKSNKTVQPANGRRPVTLRNTTNLKSTSTGQKLLQGLVDVVTSVKKIRFSYSENNGTILPGYRPEVGFLGRDNYGGSSAPTLGFVFGSQSDIRSIAAANNWLISRSVGEDYFSKNYVNTHTNKLDLSADVRPFKDLDIEVSANRMFTRNTSQQLDVLNGTLQEDLPISEIGNFSMSYFMLPNSFDGNGDATFEKFKANREVIASRLAARAGQVDNTGYGLNSQEVLIPAFLSTYSGQDAKKAKLGAFKDVPLPNWKITYKGLMNYDWFKERFRSFSVEHSYRSTYSVIGFSSNLRYDANNPVTDINGNYQPKTLFSGVQLEEQFWPLVKVDMRLKNSFSIRAEMKQDKSLSLNVNNNTITEIRGKEYQIGIGYRLKDVKLKIKTGPTSTQFKGDVNFKADFSIRNNSTTIRSIDVLNNQVTGGEHLLSYKFVADYTLNKNLQASFYFDRSASRYLISTTYPRKSTSAGISLRYTIGN